MVERNDSLSRLLVEDSVRARTELYVRLIYSPARARESRAALGAPGAVAAATRAFLHTVDFDRLAIEQRARHRNLANRFRSTCPILFGLLGESEQLPAVARFCDSPEFWEMRGRTLAESFALFVWRERWADAPSPAGFAARLEAVIDALKEHPSVPTPWVGHSHEKGSGQDGAPFEQLVSPWAILRAEGIVTSPLDLEGLGPARSPGFRLKVALDGDDVVLGCEQIVSKET